MCLKSKTIVSHPTRGERAVPQRKLTAIIQEVRCTPSIRWQLQLRMILWIHFRPNHVVSCRSGDGDHVAKMVSAFRRVNSLLYTSSRAHYKLLSLFQREVLIFVLVDMSVNCLKAFIFFTAQIHTIIRTAMVTMAAQSPMCNNNMTSYLMV